MSEDELLNTLNASESLKQSENNFDDTKPKYNFFKIKNRKDQKRI